MAERSSPTDSTTEDPPRRTRRRARGDGGAALVEFAIVAPLLFALLLGMLTGGIALSRKNSMTSAVREGARFGATLPEDTPGWANSVRDRVVALAPEDLSTNQVCVQLVRTPAQVKTTSTGCPAAMQVGSVPPSLSSVPANTCVVRVWARRTDKMEWVFASRNLTLDARAISAFERECT